MFLAENLRFLRQKFNLSQADAADKIGIPRTTLGDYERGHTEPNLEMLDKIAAMYQVQLESLIKLKLSKIAWEDVSSDKVKVLAITVDQDEKANIELVRTKAAAGYLDSFQDPEFISELPRLHIPALQGRYRAFEIEGDSMLPMESGSIVICKYVEKIQDIKKNESYILISNRDGVVYKRIQKDSQNKSLICISDNKTYPVFQMPWEEVAEVWEYQAHIAFRDPKYIHDSLTEEKLEDIQNKISDLHKHYIGKEGENKN